MHILSRGGMNHPGAPMAAAEIEKLTGSERLKSSGVRPEDTGDALTDAVVNVTYPCFEPGEHEKKTGKQGLRNLHVATLRDSAMAIATLTRPRLTTPGVGDEGDQSHEAGYEGAAF